MQVTPPAKAPEHPGFLSGSFYQQECGGAAGLLVTENRIYYVPKLLPVPARIDRLGFSVGTGAGDAECQAYVGIYANNNGHPGAKLFQSTAIAVGTGTGDKLATVDWVVPAGIIWMALICNRNAGATGTMPTLFRTTFAAGSAYANLLGWTSSITTPTLAHGDSESGTVTTWATYSMPAVAAGARLASAAPIMAFRAA
ncbi:hypothetical protein [Mesorhizobium sp. M0643]|uniref:hypothetical protein n=1 Tax=unclassified Mesorhizobium TaxID=325217 RepID=UPI0033393D12